MNFNYKLSQDEAQIILDALVKQPYIEVVDVINNIQGQANYQMRKEEEAIKKAKQEQEQIQHEEEIEKGD